MVVDDSDNGLKAVLIELNKSLKSFTRTSNNINGLVSKNDQNISEILNKFKVTSQDLSVLTGKLKDANLDQTVKSLNKTLNNFNAILVKLEKGDGTMGKFFNDDALYNNIEGATKELESLLKDVKLHPNRYTRILSKKEIPYKEPESN